MNTQIQWQKIIQVLAEGSREFPTKPITNRTPVWFKAETNGEVVYITEATEHRPSSKLKMPRRLTLKKFDEVYPYYLKRLNGEQVSREVASVTVDQVYYFSLMYHLCD